MMKVNTARIKNYLNLNGNVPACVHVQDNYVYMHTTCKVYMGSHTQDIPQSFRFIDAHVCNLQNKSVKTEII